MSKVNSIPDHRTKIEGVMVKSKAEGRERIALAAKPSLTNIIRKINVGSFAGALAIEAAMRSGVRPSKLRKFQKALDILDGLTDLSLPGLNTPGATKEALADRETVFQNFFE